MYGEISAIVLVDVSNRIEISGADFGFIVRMANAARSFSIVNSFPESQRFEGCMLAATAATVRSCCSFHYA